MTQAPGPGSFTPIFWTLVVAAGMVASVIIVIAPSQDDSATSEAFPAFTSKSELQAYLEDSWEDYQSDDFSMVRAPTGAETDLSDAEGAGYSTSTNVQVQGVDELDMAKTDGQYLYVSTSTNLTIVKAYPPEELAIVSVLDAYDLVAGVDGTNGASIQGLFISGDTVVVISYAWMDADESSTEEDDVIDSWSYELPFTVVSVVDVSDRASPVVRDWVSISGYSNFARMVGDVVYVATNHYIWYDSETDLMPEIVDDGTRENVPVETVHYDPDAAMAELYLNVLAYDFSTFEQNTISVIAGWSSTMYMSEDSIYVTFQKWLGDLIPVDSELSPEDEDSVITTIYKIRADGLDIEPVAAGDVKGWLLDQFSMDEQGDHLRVATTRSWSSPSNAVYVLDANLEIVGMLEGVAPTEQIYAARFLGDTLYLVTFMQTDPLFVIDLSDPTDPHIMGELVLPGFSSYLHPIGADHLIGLGRENGTLKLSLFDVSDPSDPKETDKYTFDYGYYTEAEWCHYAFTYDPMHAILVLPVESWVYYDLYEEEAFYVFGVSASDGISLKGIIDCTGMGLRSFVTDDYIYTITSWSVCAVTVDRLETVSEVAYGWYPYWTEEPVEPSAP